MLRIFNNFHNTEAQVRPRQGKVSPRAISEALRKLCPRDGCQCSRDALEPPRGWQWNAEGGLEADQDARRWLVCGVDSCGIAGADQWEYAHESPSHSKTLNHWIRKYWKLSERKAKTITTKEAILRSLCWVAFVGNSQFDEDKANRDDSVISYVDTWDLPK